MVEKIDSLKMRGLEGCIQTMEVITLRQSYQELTQSLINIKNNILECIHSLESTIQIKPSLIYTMRNTMKDIEHAKQVIYTMKNCKNTGIDSLRR